MKEIYGRHKLWFRLGGIIIISWIFSDPINNWFQGLTDWLLRDGRLVPLLLIQFFLLYYLLHKYEKRISKLEGEINHFKTLIGSKD